MSESELIEKAKNFEKLLNDLDSNKVFFSKKQLENYHSKLEGDFDCHISKFEDDLLNESNDNVKEKFYKKLFNFFRR